MSNSIKSGLEIERKYIIEMPDRNILMLQKDYTSSSILQIYLPSQNGETHRIRKRSYSDRVECTETRKIRLNKMSSHEIEGEISEEEFARLALNPLPESLPIEKTRYTFSYCNQIFEIDVYPRWTKTAIMETELDECEREVEIPSFIKIIREVTGDKSYSNASMSRKFPDEEVI